MRDELCNIDRLRQRRGEKWSHYPADVLPAWVADMDFDIAEPIRAAVEDRLARSDCGYPAAGATGLPEILAARVREHFNWSVKPDQIELFNDVMQAVYFGLFAFSEEHDGILIQTPIYPPFIGATKASRRHPVLCPLILGAQHYEIDFDRLRASVDQATRVMLLCNPHNPTGRCFSRAELESLAEFCLERGMTIISDEIHADLVYAPHRHVPIASLSPEVAASTVSLMSASKAFNIAGICLAFVIFGSGSLRRRFAKLPRHLSGGDIGVKYRRRDRGLYRRPAMVRSRDANATR